MDAIGPTPAHTMLGQAAPGIDMVVMLQQEAHR